MENNFYLFIIIIIIFFRGEVLRDCVQDYYNY